jgi:exopolysaccharide biosynthesis predicted pyruvyltransferase EpsI
MSAVDTVETANRGLIAELRQRVLEAIGDTVGPRGPCVVIDYPRHLNVGDQAIWLGERSALRALGIAVTMACERADYAPARLRRSVGDGVVALHGGGNFGDLYPTHHALRERVLADFRGTPLVQLAQSISFADANVLDRTRRLVAEHGDVTLIVRDRASEAFARATFEARIVLAPDSAFALGALPPPAQPASEPVAYLARTDRETAHAPPEGHVTFDWLAQPTALRERLALVMKEARLTAATGRRASGRRALRLGGPAVLRSFDDYAAWSVRRGTRLLSQGRVIVTDRLHGHILCTLMSVPHIVLDSSDGKIRNFWETWTSGSPIARWADDPSHALDLAGELARNGT